MESKKLVSLSFLIPILLGFASGSHGDVFSYSSTDSFYDSLDNPRTALTNFVAPFLLVAIIFQRGFEKALHFSYAEDDQFNKSNEAERKRVRKYSMIMALAVTGMIVPSPYFQILQDYIAILFGTASYIFFFAIVAGFLWVLWEAFS